MTAPAQHPLARQVRDELRGLWEVVSKQVIEQKLRTLPLEQKESFERALEQLMPDWDPAPAPAPVVLTPKDHAEALARAVRGGVISRQQALELGKTLQEAGIEVVRTVTAPAPPAPPSPPPAPPRELTLEEMVGRIVFLAGSGALSPAQIAELSGRLRAAGLCPERAQDGASLVSQLVEAVRGEGSEDRKREWGETLRAAGLSVQAKESGGWELPKEFAATFGMPGTVTGAEMRPERVCLLAMRLAEALERIYEEAWQAWWDLPSEAPPGDVQVPDTGRLRPRLKSVLEAGNERFKENLATALRPTHLVVGLLRSTVQASEQFAEDNYRKFIAREIAFATRRDGSRDASAFWRRFEEMTRDWDKQKVVDLFRDSTIAAVVKDSEGGLYLKEIKERHFSRLKWPWGGC